MQILELKIPGCFEIQLLTHTDSRGSFVKTFQRAAFVEFGLDTDFVEAFVTTSGENVLRGMHLQLPPADHSKLVYCLAGSVHDVLLDLRVGSPSFGKHLTTDLSAARFNAMYVPKGVAHGFHVIQAPAVMMYHVTSAHAPHLDAGVAWNSFGARWVSPKPHISLRDESLPPLADFSSPFTYPYFDP